MQPKHFRRAGLVALFIALSAGAADEPSRDVPPEMRGRLNPLTFTTRSPLSSRAELSKRLGEKITDPDYDLSKEEFVAYIPFDADLSGKMGVIYFFCYKDTEEGPEPCYPLLDQKHLVFITCKHSNQEPWVRCGLALDAVQNLKGMFRIDEKRVYAIAGAEEKMSGERAVLACPDVFTGGALVGFWPYRQVVTPSRKVYTSVVPKPPAAQFELLRQRPLVLGSGGDGEQEEFYGAAFKSFQQDGFKRLKRMKVTLEQYHYPNFTTDWLTEAIDFWDATPPPGPAKPVVAAPQPSAPQAPATPAAGAPAAPAAANPGDAQRLVNAAKSYISAQAYAQARTRLNTVVEKFPDTPAAKEAKQLLDQIKGK